MANTTNISALPLEVILNTLLPILIRHDLTNCVLVNKQWNDIFAPSIWHTINFDLNTPVDPHLPWLHDLAKHFNFHQFELCALSSGSLRKNGHLIRKVDATYSGMIDILMGTTEGYDRCGGPEEVCCEGLVELVVGDGRKSDNIGFLNQEHPLSQPQDVLVASVVTLLEKNQQLRKLSFVGTLLKSSVEESARMIRAIPVSVEDLSITNWGPSLPSGSPSSSDSDLLLSNLKTLNYAKSDINNLHLLLKRSPKLEHLVLKNVLHPEIESVPWLLVASTFQELCPRLASLHLVKCSSYSDDEFSGMIEAGMKVSCEKVKEEEEEEKSRFGSNATTIYYMNTRREDLLLTID
ncbi:hypothetical protein BGW39_007403 [Mortierella sp. 14UC]|nr:hypothetical protein BGW39_007403 [Mortierella sp. 14UC]